MEREVSLPCLQEPATVLYSESDKSSKQSRTVVNTLFKYYSFHIEAMSLELFLSFKYLE